MDAVKKYLPLAAAAIITVVLVVMGFVPKFLSDPNSVYMFGTTLTNNSGMGFWEPYGRYAIGVFELATVVMLWWPGRRKTGGLMAALLMVGAVFSHILWIGIETQFPAGPAGADGVIPTEGDGGMLFTVAVITLLCGLYLYLKGDNAPAAEA